MSGAKEINFGCDLGWGARQPELERQTKTATTNEKRKAQHQAQIILSIEFCCGRMNGPAKQE